MRKSDRKRKSKKRSLNEMSGGNGNSANERTKKRQKTTHKKSKNLAQYVSPAPVEWSVREVRDRAGEEAEPTKRGRFVLKLKVKRHPNKQALRQIGSKPFTLSSMLDVLEGITDDRASQST